MLRRISCLAVLCTLSSGAAFGAQLYFGAGLGSGVDGGSFRAGLEGFADSSGDRSRLFAGLRLLENLAVEAAWYDFGTQRCCRQVADLAFETETDGVSAAALGLWPMRYGTAFVKAGALSWDESGELVTLIGPSAASADGVDPFYGVGFDLTLIGRLGLRLEWERYEFDDASSDGLWASLFLRLGKRR